MFEFLFKYPSSVFSKGDFVMLAPLPWWTLAVAVLAAAAFLAWHMNRNRGLLSGARPAAIWVLQTALVALVLFLLWHPAISIATLRPQQTIVAVLVDDSRSMATKDGARGTKTRLEEAVGVLNQGVIDRVGERFQVRLYRFGKAVERIGKPVELTASGGASRIGDSLKQAMAEASTLPLGAVVLLSDGADNSGGIDLETIAAIRQKRIPVHAVGFGKEKFDRDVEIDEVILPARTLADSRLNAQVTLRQNGYEKRKTRLSVREGNKVLATSEVTLKSDGAPQTETLLFNAGMAGARTFQVSVDPLDGEQNTANNALSRLVSVESVKPRVLYFDGEPQWEFKFIRRAIEEDRSLGLVTMIRMTQNKIYRQGVDKPKELEDGFPAKADELFAYQALVFGSVEASYFTTAQQELIREFANRRGGGMIFLGGRATLGDGGYLRSPLAEMLPVQIPDRKGTFHRDEASAELTPVGRESLICRLEERPEKNADRWKKMPVMADYQEVGDPKPGAVVLLETLAPGRRKLPLLAIQNYGRGRTAVFATSGSWRWQMQQPLPDKTHEMFWQQFLRWAVADTPGRVHASTPRPVLSDETSVKLRAEVRDRNFKMVPSAKVEARIIGPEGTAAVVEMNPVPDEDGVYAGEWAAEKPGSYVAEVVALQDKEETRDAIAFRREDGVAENFHTGQNRELLEKLAESTGGRYYTPAEASTLADRISYSEAGLTVRDTKDLWDMPIVFFLALLLRSGEWVLRRKWGVV